MPLWMLACLLLMAGNASASTLFLEDFEGFPPGSVPGVSGWTSDLPDWVEIQDTGEPQLEDRSVTFFGHGFLALSKDVIRSPEFGPGYAVLSVDVLIRGGGSGGYLVGPWDDGGGIQVTYARFNADSTIDAFQELQYSGIWLATSGQWTPGEVTRLAFDLTERNKLHVYQDGQLLLSGDSMSTTFGGTGISGLVVKATGSTSGSEISIDNVHLGDVITVPEPSAFLMQLVGLAVVICLARFRERGGVKRSA